VDGSLVEQYNILPPLRKQQIAEELDRTPSEVSKQIELMRTRAT
jgi:splicing factor 3B subunit 3